MDDTLGILTGAGGGGLLGMILMGIFNWYTNRGKDKAQTDAVIADATGKTTLIDVLEARIAASEARQTAQDGRIAELENRIAQEVDLRLKAQEENHTLRLRVLELEYAIKQMKDSAIHSANIHNVDSPK
jgi:ammonia channel protein AmtB